MTENRKVARTGLAISAFGEDQDGELYFTAFDGQVHQFRKRPVDAATQRQAFPRKLSETGLFAAVAEHRPAPGLIPYDVNVPLWSDRAQKLRYLALPQSHSVQFDAKDNWQFPVGTVLVKTFLLPAESGQGKPRRLETRLLAHSPDGWVGYTYLWNDQQTDATLLDGSLVKSYRTATAKGPVEQSWYFPSREDCLACHASSTRFVLGLNARQMNRPWESDSQAGNQLDRLARLGVFTASLPSSSTLEAYPRWDARNDDAQHVSAESLAKAYLDVQCAMCHAPKAMRGPNPDFRFHTPLEKMNLVNRNAGQGRLGPQGSKLLVPGSVERSEIHQRAAVRGSRQMPPLATNVVDEDGLAVLRRWIEGM